MSILNCTFFPDCISFKLHHLNRKDFKKIGVKVKLINYGLVCSMLPKICIYLNLISFLCEDAGHFIVVVTVLFLFSSLRKGLKCLAIWV